MPDAGKNRPLITETFVKSGIPRSTWMNKVAHECNMLTSSPDLTKTPTGYRYTASAKSEPWTLKHSISSGVVTITAGTISYGSVDIPVAGGDVTLNGSPEFVYVRLERATEATTLGHASERPASDSTYAYFMLVSFTATAGVYKLDKIHHRGDIYLQVPMQ